MPDPTELDAVHDTRDGEPAGTSGAPRPRRRGRTARHRPPLPAFGITCAAVAVAFALPPGSATASTAVGSLNPRTPLTDVTVPAPDPAASPSPTASSSPSSPSPAQSPSSPSPAPSPSPRLPSVPRTAVPPTPPVGVIGGNDISWPQCSVARGGYGNPMPDDRAEFVVIGLSHGKAFSTNPCLADQLAFARKRHLLVAAYVLPTYPTNAQYKAYGGKGPYSTRSVQGRLRNVGWQEAKYWVAVMRRSGLRTPMVWVDVEQRKRGPKWPDRPADRNLPVLQGLLAGLKHAGYRTGIYTTSSHWNEITGGVRLGLPEWRTVGRKGPAEALATCGKPGNQGSPVLMAQYFTSNVDYDVLCPVMTRAYIGRYFRRY